MLDAAVQPWLPVVTEVVVDQLEVTRAASENTNLVAANVRIDDADVLSALDSDRDTPGLIRVGIRSRTLESAAGKINGDVVAANDDDRGIHGFVRGEPIRVLNDARRLRDHQTSRQSHLPSLCREFNW